MKAADSGATDAAETEPPPSTPRAPCGAALPEGGGILGPIVVELAFTDPTAAEGLTRLAAWRDAAAAGAAATGGPDTPRKRRPPPAAVALAWQDTASGALARRGLALEVPRRGPRVLWRILPDPGAPWRPGLPPEWIAVLDPAEAATLPDLAGFDSEERKAPLLPLAAFEGHRARFALAARDAAPGAPPSPPVAAELLTGRLRAVAAERAVARLTLAGPAEPVLALARALAAELPLLPPPAALAEEARALALGEPVRPRRTGPPLLAAAPDARAGLGLALGHLAESLLFHAQFARAGAGPEGVHQMRVALRRMRSVLRLFRPVATDEEAAALHAFAARLKALASTLGPARDWDVFLGGFGADLAAMLPEEPRLAALLRAARSRRAEAYTTLRQVLDGPEFRVLACDAIALALRFGAPEAPPDPAASPRRAAAQQRTDETLPAAAREPLDRFAAAALDRRWRKLRARGEAMSASLEDDALHALRLEGKRMRYAAEIFAPLWPGKASRRFVRRLAALQEALGLANDAATARRLVAGLDARLAAAQDAGPGGKAERLDGRRRAGDWAIGLVEGFALARARRVRKRALRAWEALLRRAPFWERD